MDFSNHSFYESRVRAASINIALNTYSTKLLVLKLKKKSNVKSHLQSYNFVQNNSLNMAMNLRKDTRKMSFIVGYVTKYTYTNNVF